MTDLSEARSKFKYLSDASSILAESQRTKKKMTGLHIEITTDENTNYELHSSVRKASGNNTDH